MTDRKIDQKILDFIEKYHPTRYTGEQVEELTAKYSSRVSELINESIPAALEAHDPQVETREGRTNQYEVAFGWCFNDRPRKMVEIEVEIEAYLKSIDLYPDEYFGISSSYLYRRNIDQRESDLLFPADYWRVICYSVPGGSEGWYIHVDALLKDGKAVSLFCGKTLQHGGGVAASRYAQKIAEALTLYFNFSAEQLVDAYQIKQDEKVIKEI